MLALCLAQAAWAQAHPFGVPESGGAGPGWMSGVFGQIAVWQSHFYRQLTGAVRAWQADGTAAWLLLGLSFAYGVFHALGPGHGKAVIAAYVVANRQTARNGAILALVSALLQALVAIVMVAVLGWLLSVTAAEMNRATAWLEVVSYGLIVALGIWLVWRKALRPLLPARRSGHADTEHAVPAHASGHAHTEDPIPAHPPGHAQGQVKASAVPLQGARSRHIPIHAAPAHAHPHHHHDDDCGCGHAHVAPADAVAGKLDLRRAAAAIAAVGLRPCSGALIVLVFALAQDFFIAGVAAALAMGVGTGLTVAMLTMLAAWTRAGAVRLGARLSSPAAARLRYLIDALAALFVLMLGILLLGGQLALN
ncbi:nickel/cobalt transporter [Pseudomonadota bacterium AL_CKDN230030165-1A_HGKHYDSX7]